MRGEKDFHLTLPMKHVLIDAGKGGISSKTIVIIVVPTFVSVVIFSILCYCFIRRCAKKRYDTLEAENGKILAPNLNDPMFLVPVMVFTITINVQQICWNHFFVQLSSISPPSSHCNLIWLLFKLLQITSLTITRLVRVDLVPYTR